MKNTERLKFESKAIENRQKEEFSKEMVPKTQELDSRALCFSSV